MTYNRNTNLYLSHLDVVVVLVVVVTVLYVFLTSVVVVVLVVAVVPHVVGYTSSRRRINQQVPCYWSMT